MQAKKSLGQNFLRDFSVITKIASVLNKEDTILEIGAGKGALTNVLVNEGFSVDAIEFDKELVDYLNEQFKGFGNIKILQANAVDFKLSQNYTVVGNLPYNVSKRIIVNMINQKNMIKKMVFMLQKEVANTILAKPNTKSYTKFSVFVQIFCSGRKFFCVENKSFFPVPKVKSTVIELVPHPINIFNEEINPSFFEFLNVLFSQPLKTIKNNLKDRVSLENLNENILEARPRQLSIQDIYKFFKYLEKEKKWV